MTFETVSLGGFFITVIIQLWAMNRTMGRSGQRHETAERDITKLVKAKHDHANKLQSHEGRISILEYKSEKESR